jgi:hypothetical protein
MLTPTSQKPTSALARVACSGRSWPVVLSATLMLTLAAGCGSGSSSTKSTATTATATITKAEFMAKANAICAAADPNLAAENAKLAAHPTAATVVAAVKTVYVPSVQSQIAGIKALGTPSGDQATVSRMLQLIEGDLHKITANPRLMVTTNVFGDFAKVAHPYGLTACAPLS